MANDPPIHWYVRAGGTLTSIACGKPVAPGRFTDDPMKCSCRGCIVSAASEQLAEPLRNEMWATLNERRGTDVDPPWVRERQREEKKAERAAKKKARAEEAVEKAKRRMQRVGAPF
jgi:hypothetical protein